jgi:hypothetical protein
VIVAIEGEPMLMAVPLDKGIESQAVRLEFAAVHLYGREQISLGAGRADRWVVVQRDGEGRCAGVGKPGACAERPSSAAKGVALQT